MRSATGPGAGGEDLGALLSQLLKVVVEREEPILQDNGLSMWEYVIMTRLMSAGGVTQKELASKTRRDPTRLIGNLDALDERGLVQREVDTADRRRRTVRLTAQGQELVLAVRAAISRMESGAFGDHADELRDMLRTAVRAAQAES